MRTIAQERVRQRLKARVSSLSPASRRRWGKMNVQQMLTHVAGGMELVMSGDQFGAEPRGGQKLMKWIALISPMPWPRGVPNGRDPAGVPVPETEFPLVRDRVLAALEAMAAWEKGPETPVHPAFGDLTTEEWHRWAYRHAHHHLRQFSA